MISKMFSMGCAHGSVSSDSASLGSNPSPPAKSQFAQNWPRSPTLGAPPTPWFRSHFLAATCSAFDSVSFSG